MCCKHCKTTFLQVGDLLKRSKVLAFCGEIHSFTGFVEIHGTQSRSEEMDIGGRGSLLSKRGYLKIFLGEKALTSRSILHAETDPD